MHYLKMAVEVGRFLSLAHSTLKQGKKLLILFNITLEFLTDESEMDAGQEL